VHHSWVLTSIISYIRSTALAVVTLASYNVLHLELYWDNDYKSRKVIPYSSGFADDHVVDMKLEPHILEIYSWGQSKPPTFIVAEPDFFREI